MSIRKLVALVFGVSLPVVFPAVASAHSFGISFTLPLPFWLYAYGGAAAVIASFLIISYLVGKREANREPKELDVTDKGLKFATKGWFINSGKILSVFLFAMVIATGLIGSGYSTFNLTLFWIIFAYGLTYLVAVIGDIYSVINPIKVLMEWAEKLFRFRLAPMYKYPAWLSYYPALVFYFLFIYIELFTTTSSFNLSTLLLQYLVISVAGVNLWGKDIWFKYCDFFAVFFGIVGKISIFHKREGRIFLRPPFVGLLEQRAVNFSQLLFILFMLSSTAFDGFRYTKPSIWLYEFIGFIPFSAFKFIVFILSPFVFLGVYIFLIWLTKLISKSERTLKELALYFAFSLVPIAVVYNVAHYYTLLVVEGQSFIGLISDPFGFGWNLFGTAGLQPNIKLVDTVITWYAQIGLILLGHIAAVYLAHVDALRVFTNAKRAVASQLPMLLLMVIYTMAGLWILAQPITNSSLF